jgi:hypothetical protein
MRWMVVLALVGCIAQARQAIAPEPQSDGTLSCKAIVETCDANCSDPLCLMNCTGQGTAEARPQHQALLDCGQQHACTDEDCMRANCPSQIDTCWGQQGASQQPAQGGD